MSEKVYYPGKDIKSGMRGIFPANSPEDLKGKRFVVAVRDTRCDYANKWFIQIDGEPTTMLVSFPPEIDEDEFLSIFPTES